MRTSTRHWPVTALTVGGAPRRAKFGISGGIPALFLRRRLLNQRVQRSEGKRRGSSITGERLYIAEAGYRPSAQLVIYDERRQPEATVIGDHWDPTYVILEWERRYNRVADSSLDPGCSPSMSGGAEVLIGRNDLTQAHLSLPR